MSGHKSCSLVCVIFDYTAQLPGCQFGVFMGDDGADYGDAAGTGAEAGFCIGKVNSSKGNDDCVGMGRATLGDGIDADCIEDARFRRGWENRTECVKMGSMGEGVCGVVETVSGITGKTGEFPGMEGEGSVTVVVSGERDFDVETPDEVGV